MFLGPAQCVQPVFSFTLKFKSFFLFFSFCCFPLLFFIVALILVSFVCLRLHSFCADFLGERSVCHTDAVRVRVLKSFIIVIVIVIIQFLKSLSLLKQRSQTSLPRNLGTGNRQTGLHYSFFHLLFLFLLIFFAFGHL